MPSTFTRIQNLKPDPPTKRAQKKSREDEDWDGRTWGPQLCACANRPMFNNGPSTSPSLQDGGSLHKQEKKSPKSSPQTFTMNSQKSTKCANPFGAFPASNLTTYIQLPRDIHEMSSNGARPWFGP